MNNNNLIINDNCSTTSEVFTICQASSEHTAHDISLFLVIFMMCVFSAYFSVKKN